VASLLSVALVNQFAVETSDADEHLGIATVVFVVAFIEV
jgi:hypothetical protein